MIMEKAQEIGRLIGQSDEYRALKRADERVNDQADIQEKMNRAAALAQEIEQITADGSEPPKDKVDEYDSLVSAVQAEPSYQGVVAAQSNFDKLMAKVNAEIMEGIKKGAESPIITLS